MVDQNNITLILFSVETYDRNTLWLIKTISLLYYFPPNVELCLDNAGENCAWINEANYVCIQQTSKAFCRSILGSFLQEVLLWKEEPCLQLVSERDEQIWHSRLRRLMGTQLRVGAAGAEEDRAVGLVGLVVCLPSFYREAMLQDSSYICHLWWSTV